MIYKNPQITVGIPIHGGTEFRHIRECIQSLLNQDYEQFDILVVSEDTELSQRLRDEFDAENLSVEDIQNEDGGLSKARNEIFQRADGSVVAYIDADATAEENWLSELAGSYRDKEVPAVGGRADPKWESKKPLFLPSEFFWLVGVTDSNHPNHGESIRNAFGCNMSFKKDVLERIGGFSSEVGKVKDLNLQGEEPEIGERLRSELNVGVYYNDNARINHSVVADQTTLKWLSNRAYLQGISKAVMKDETGSNLSKEKRFLSDLVGSVAKYIRRTITGPNRVESFVSIFAVGYFTMLVGIGYLYGSLRNQIS